MIIATSQFFEPQKETTASPDAQLSVADLRDSAVAFYRRYIWLGVVFVSFIRRIYYEFEFQALISGRELVS